VDSCGRPDVRRRRRLPRAVPADAHAVEQPRAADHRAWREGWPRTDRCVTVRCSAGRTARLATWSLAGWASWRGWLLSGVS